MMFHRHHWEFLVADNMRVWEDPEKRAATGRAVTIVTYTCTCGALRQEEFRGLIADSLIAYFARKYAVAGRLRGPGGGGENTTPTPLPLLTTKSPVEESPHPDAPLP